MHTVLYCIYIGLHAITYMSEFIGTTEMGVVP